MTTTGRGHAAVVLVAVGIFAASPAIAGSDVVHTVGHPGRYATVVPEAARLEVDAEYDAGGHTRITLGATGLAPRTSYAGRVTWGGCTVRASGLGPTYQLVPAPPDAAPFHPEYTNKVNEVWLELKTDDSGAGTAVAVQPWQFAPEERPGSVILHQHVVPVRPGGTTAGRRLACIEVAF
jgi:Cu-Zn family superoxide dismutase